MDDFWQTSYIPTEKIDLSAFGIGGFSLFIKREDLLHPFVSGNKFRKLKYNIESAQLQSKDTLLTFGGAFSNHIAATAAAGKEFEMKTIGIIRGEELADKIGENPTLTFAQNCGMQFHFVSRETYRQKETSWFLNDLKEKFGDFYLVPEGGTNSFAVKGCTEILDVQDKIYDYVCVPVGTGGTIAGLIEASGENQNILGFSALNGIFQSEGIKKYTSKRNYKLIDSYCFGGYGKIEKNLVRFINDFRSITGIPLDPVYTGKMLFGIMDLLKIGYFSENSRILAVHTGGLQGVAGMNAVLKRKKLPLIE
ncbi:1-aminocyclopropane-1-carboxylate deaminase/D-cysteine desulfhydrase [Aequorivita sp. H23M31]|uniref:1-aminocyclopropane-1-carboxylate deaminase/D-cysteine desulfhydrase n=1 Tax=Aequorivita ciconiae TaxID=2494375 RepID=A0A410G3I3_9FLAO|nr:pyridoxal-phosphate dependent enzyme [Aequorivita sp. H23M31]QAA81775.1 1-aminocyclopropane-1-carboxylate deaminase/D-cysteine desulfhydrase [Aequorivita sp. H23M31]